MKHEISSVQDVLEVQAKLMSSWPGTALDNLGLIRIVNADGRQAPFFWIFNAADEPLKLGQAFENDRPLIFTRSSHLLARKTESQQAVRKILANYLVDALEPLVQNRGPGFRFGANCQGCEPLIRIVNALHERGHGTDELVLIACQLPPVNSKTRALLLYGDRDPANNPFAADRARAEALADRMFPAYKRQTLISAHGQYFEPRRVESLVRHLDQQRRVIDRLPFVAHRRWLS